MTKPKLSVIIPAFNEVANLRRGVLDQVDEYLKKQSYPYEVLIVDDGSKDKTVEILEEQIKNKKSFTLVKNPHGGKAITVMTGLLKSKGEISLFTDMDQATPLPEIEKLLPKFEEGYDIVIAARQGRKGAPLIRKLMGRGFAVARMILLGLPIADTQCGFKAFSRGSIETIFPGLIDSWQKMKASGAAVNAGFDVETLFIARKKELKIAEIFVDWRHVGSERVQAVGDSIAALKDMIRIRLNDLQGKYD